jgi:8-oxo-dGTP pyrophosphatase MutT (NUDIX family)
MIPADLPPTIQQAGVVPFHRRSGRIEICLITTRKGNWIFPKGIIDPGETMEQAAAKEALEEAGIAGRIIDPPLGHYEYFKWGTTLNVTVLLMEVLSVEDAWEEDWRQRRWVSFGEAQKLVQRPELKGLLSTAIARIEGS